MPQKPAIHLHVPTSKIGGKRQIIITKPSANTKGPKIAIARPSRIASNIVGSKVSIARPYRITPAGQKDTIARPSKITTIHPEVTITTSNATY
jgi:hypothetical protein